MSASSSPRNPNTPPAPVIDLSGLPLPSGFKPLDPKKPNQVKKYIPAWVSRIETSPPTPLRPELFPTETIDTSYNPAEIINNTPLPRVAPILLGARLAIANFQAERAQTKLERLAEDEKIIRFAGKVIVQGGIQENITDVNGTRGSLKGKGYMHPDNPLRPTTQSQLSQTRKLERLTDKRRQSIRIVTGAKNLYPDEIPGPGLATRERTLTEKLNINKQRRTYGRLVEDRKITRLDSLPSLDRSFVEVMTYPLRKSAVVIADRNKSVAKAAALEQAQVQRAQRQHQKQQRRNNP